jgi:hypothetical protein
MSSDNAQAGAHFFPAGDIKDVRGRIDFRVSHGDAAPVGSATDWYKPALFRRVKRGVAWIGHVADIVQQIIANSAYGVPRRIPL